MAARARIGCTILSKIVKNNSCSSRRFTSLCHPRSTTLSSTWCQKQQHKFLPATQIRCYAEDPMKGTGFFEDDPQHASGKTEVTILNREQDGMVFMDSYSSIGFRLNSGIRIMGPCAVFPKSILHWNIKGVEDISEDSLCLFTMLEPKIDILILGVGERENTAKINPRIITYLRSKGIGVEILPTDQALATFNFLNSERRYVAGAFIPPSYMEDISDEDYAYQSLVDQGYDPHDPGEYMGGDENKHLPHEFEGAQIQNTMDEIKNIAYRTKEREEEKKRGGWKDQDQF